MTHLDLLTQTLSEVTGTPEDFTRMIVATGFIITGADMSKVLADIPDAEYQRLLAAFRQEKAGILNCLLEGKARAERKLRHGGL